MTTTGWTGDGPDDGPAAPGGFAGFIGSMRGGPEDKPDALARAMHAPEPRDPEPRDPDEVAAGLMVRGYPAGHVSDLGQRLADKSAELAAEREKIAKGERVNARVRGMLERGQIGGLEAARMMDGDFGDAHRAEQLQRQCKNLERQIGDAAAMISPAAERAPDQFASANRTAHELFRAATQQQMAAAQAGVRRSERRPFAGRGSVATMDAEPHFSGSLWNPGQEIRRGNLGAAAQETTVRAPTGRLEDLGYGQSSPDGCPPCSGCHYVICKCGGRVYT